MQDPRYHICLGSKPEAAIGRGKEEGAAIPAASSPRPDWATGQLKRGLITCKCSIKALTSPELEHVNLLRIQ